MKSMMGILTEETNKKQFVRLYSDGGGSDFADEYNGKTNKILVSDTLPNEPFKDDSYMEKSDIIKNMIQSINDGEELPPIKVIQHPYDETKYIVVDGNHRRYAYTQSDVHEVDAIIIPHEDVILMKSKWGEKNVKLGNLDELKNNIEIVDRFLVKTDGTNSFIKSNN